MKRLTLVLLVILLIVLPVVGMAEIDQTAGDLLHAMQKQVRELDNITINGVYELEIDSAGTKQSVRSTDVNVVFNDPLIIHNTATDAAGNVKEMFSIQQGDRMVVYASHANEAYKVGADEIETDGLEPETMGEKDAVTHPIDDMVAAKIVGDETVTVNGKEYACTRISILVDGDDMLENVIHNTLLTLPASDSDWSDKIEVAVREIEIPIEYWLDKETGMLVQYSLGLQEGLAAIYEAIPDEADKGMTFSKYSVLCQVTGVNDAQPVLVPAEYIAYNEH